MLPVLSEAALADRCTASNPKLVTREEIAAIYRQGVFENHPPRADGITGGKGCAARGGREGLHGRETECRQ